MELKTKKGISFLIDDEDFDRIKDFTWYLSCHGYIKTDVYNPFTQGNIPIYLHRLLMNASKGKQVDHVDRNKLNNQKSNLRFSTQSQNMMNCKRKSKTGYRGVYETGYNHTLSNGETKRYITIFSKINTGIYNNGKPVIKHLGTFDTIIDAAKAYNEAAIKYHGEFAVLNDI